MDHLHYRDEKSEAPRGVCIVIPLPSHLAAAFLISRESLNVTSLDEKKI